MFRTNREALAALLAVIAVLLLVLGGSFVTRQLRLGHDHVVEQEQSCTSSGGVVQVDGAIFTCERN